jgi:hypothetical protein
MTYLELCQKTDVLFGSQGVFTSVATTNGFQSLIVKYVQNAWDNIQASRREWDFYRTTVSFSTVLNQMDYSLVEVFGAGVDNPVENWITDRFIRSDYSTLEYIPYDRWILEDHTTARDPRSFTTHPNLETSGFLSFDKPDGVYTYTLHYFRKPQQLSANTDIPICPTEHHDAIVFQALTDLAAHFGNRDIYSTASVRANQLYSNLLRSQNPSKTITPRPFV